MREHSEYFEPGSEALANIVDVVTGRAREAAAQRPSFGDAAGNLVTTLLRAPFLPVADYLVRHTSGPGAVAVQVTGHAANVVANEIGNLVRIVVDEVVDASRGVARLLSD